MKKKCSRFFCPRQLLTNHVLEFMPTQDMYVSTVTGEMQHQLIFLQQKHTVYMTHIWYSKVAYVPTVRTLVGNNVPAARARGAELARPHRKSVATAGPAAAVSGTRDAYTSLLPAAAARARGSLITHTAAASSATPA